MREERNLSIYLTGGCVYGVHVCIFALSSCSITGEGASHYVFTYSRCPDSALGVEGMGLAPRERSGSVGDSDGSIMDLGVLAPGGRGLHVRRIIPLFVCLANIALFLAQMREGSSGDSACKYVFVGDASARQLGGSLKRTGVRAVERRLKICLPY